MKLSACAPYHRFCLSLLQNTDLNSLLLFGTYLEMQLEMCPSSVMKLDSVTSSASSALSSGHSVSLDTALCIYAESNAT